MKINVTINGQEYQRDIDDKILLQDFLFNEMGLKSVAKNCEEGCCGACTVNFNGWPVNSCLVFAMEADGGSVVTIEGMANNIQAITLKDAFKRNNASVCEKCMPGFIISLLSFLSGHSYFDEKEVYHALKGNMCDKADYKLVVKSVMEFAKKL